MSMQFSTLANGLRVVTQRMDHLESVSLGVWIGAGARREQPREHGLSHLLEHMAFKGTDRRSARDIAEEIESVGGDLNAATSTETTAYYARVLKDDLALALDILSDILIHARFDPEEHAREQGVILQEIAAALDSPDDIVHDLAQEAAYPNQALGRTILGTAESVSALTPDDLRAYLAEHYRPDVMVVSAAGAVDHDDIARRAETLFGALAPEPAPALEPARYVGGVRHSDKAFEQSHVVVSYLGPSYREAAFYDAKVLSAILGDGMSSRLFQEARERRGLCYSIYSYCWGLSDTGLVGVHAATGHELVEELLQVVAHELRRVIDEPVSDTELARAKAQLKAGLLMSLESSSARAEQMARQVLAFGRPLTVEELTAKVEAVSIDSVREVARRMFAGPPVSFATVGPLGGLERARDLAARFTPNLAAAAE